MADGTAGGAGRSIRSGVLPLLECTQDEREAIDRLSEAWLRGRLAALREELQETAGFLAVHRYPDDARRALRLADKAISAAESVVDEQDADDVAARVERAAAALCGGQKAVSRAAVLQDLADGKSPLEILGSANHGGAGVRHFRMFTEQEYDLAAQAKAEYHKTKPPGRGKRGHVSPPSKWDVINDGLMRHFGLDVQNGGALGSFDRRMTARVKKK
jgi:hypothetical protein